MVDRIRDVDLGAGAASATATAGVKEQALDFAATARERIVLGTDLVKTYTIEQPARALGIALGMGVVLGWLIKRR